MNFKKSVFTKKLEIESAAQVVFVSDFFSDQIPNGGAELTSEALIQSSPYKVQKLRASDVSMNLLKEGHEKYWIFGNATMMDSTLIPTIVANMKYSIVEYDFKYCRARSPEKHKETTGQECDCHHQVIGKTISAFFHGAKSIFWMSEIQRDKYFELFPFLRENVNVILSSIFDNETLAKIKSLRESIETSEKSGWIILDSDSWIKGTKDAVKYCEDNGLDYNLVGSLSYDELLQTLSVSEGLVYLPKGIDTCPRMTIEAKLLDCKIVMNENVGQKNEDWFNDNDVTSIESYLRGTPSLFWDNIKSNIDHVATLSGYTTLYNAESQRYPYERVIKNMLEFCDEVCVVDGGSTDGTFFNLCRIAYPEMRQIDHATGSIYIEKINELRKLCDEGNEFPLQLDCTDNEVLPKVFQRVSNLRIKVVPRDWSSENFALYDGMQKAEARSMCTKDFCWQMDSDEILPRKYYKKLEEILESTPVTVGIIAFPVVEYWGSYEKVRIDVQPWKWRLSKNDPKITHGVPSDMIETVDGKEIVKEGTDGCDMIDKETRERLPFITFHTKETENTRQRAVCGEESSIKDYETWLNAAAEQLPTVHHYSWLDIERKIRLYRDYWQNHWRNLWNQDTKDTADNNMFFDCPWSEVTDKMIVERARELSEGTGGWIFHRKWNGQKIPHIKISNVNKL